MKDKKLGLATLRVALKMLGYEVIYCWNKKLRNTKKLTYLNSLPMSEIMVVAPMIIAEMNLNKFESKAIKVKYAKLSSYL